MLIHPYACGSADHYNRRTLLKAAGLAGLTWMTPVAEQLARAAEAAPKGAPAKSVIVLWMSGGPSQRDTFDPKPKAAGGGDIKAIKTAAKGIELAASLEKIADQMDSISLVRSVTSAEGDHERATYNVKTGFRPDPTLVHPSIGAVMCHLMEDKTVEIPRHVSILSNQWPARGGYLGDQFDAFKIGDPKQPVPDIKPRVSEQRMKRRVDDLLNVVEKSFARGRMRQLDTNKTLHRGSTKAAIRMMNSSQLKAFDVSEAPEATRQMFGDTPFGRGCLAAGRLVEAGVRCVEVTLGNWDSHINNNEIQAGLATTLDSGFAALVGYLKERKLLGSTLILCAGEFGRTPVINPAGGRDHWPHGFSVALAGGGIQGGRVIGETKPDPDRSREKRATDLVDPRPVEDIHATIFHSLGIDFEHEFDTPVGRPMAISKGKVIKELL